MNRTLKIALIIIFTPIVISAIGFGSYYGYKYVKYKNLKRDRVISFEKV